MEKLVRWSFILIGSTLGSWIPTLWHASYFSAASIIGGILGTGAGIYAMITLNDFIG